MKMEYSKPNMIVTTYVTINNTNVDNGITILSQLAPNSNQNADSRDWVIADLNQ